MFSKRSREGEILIDHRMSPGLTPADVRGFDVPAVGKGELYESAVFCCSHCQCAVIVNPQRTRERGWCQKCDQYLCDDCSELMAVTLECRPYAKVLDDLQDAIERGEPSPLLVTLSKD